MGRDPAVYMTRMQKIGVVGCNQFGKRRSENREHFFAVVFGLSSVAHDSPQPPVTRFGVCLKKPFRISVHSFSRFCEFLFLLALLA